MALSEETKQKIRLAITGKKYPNRNHKFKRRRSHICLNCNIEFNSYLDTSKWCSIPCRSAFIRKHRTEFEQYKQDCQFKFNVYEFPLLFDLGLVEKFGWYKPTNRGNNLGGVSRDHIISIRDGFYQKIDPKLMSHPANCRLMLHSDNSRKHAKSEMTVEELKVKVENQSGIAPE